MLASFQFDAASVPKILHWLLSSTGLLLIQGMVHDFSYRYDYLLTLDKTGYNKYMNKAGRKYWDQLFKEIGDKVNGISFINYLCYP